MSDDRFPCDGEKASDLFRRSLGEDGSERKLEPTEWAEASRQGWSDNVAEPLLREKLDQNPERSEWVAGTNATPMRVSNLKARVFSRSGGY